MTPDTPIHSDVSHPFSGWSNRILILAVAGILFLTLYPFRFDFGRHLPRPLFPFSLGGWGKGIGPFDDFLNVLLFVPYGFGLAEKLRERGTLPMRTVGITIAAGASLSYAVELLQIYIPFRDSGWEDVLTNSFGAAVGAVLFSLVGSATLALLSAIGQKVCDWLTWRRAALVLLLYFAFWCAAAVRLQEEARLSSWNVESLIVVGNSASNHFSSAWKGQVLGLEIWDQALSSELTQKLTAGEVPGHHASDSIVAYSFSGSAPFQDQRHFVPDLSWTPRAPVTADPNGAFLDGKSWLVSSGTATVLISELKKSGHFSLRILCEPAEISGVDARIVSISSPSGAADMELKQKDASLIFWFHTPLSARSSRMSWIIPATFAANEMRDILLSFDGANLNLFIDGQRRGRTYELGPGAALAKFIRHIRTPELEGYQYLFCALVFIPAGCLLGLAWRTMTSGWLAKVSLLLPGFILPSVILEAMLVHVSGRAVSFENVGLSILLTAAGSLWINTDRASSGALRDRNQLISAR